MWSANRDNGIHRKLSKIATHAVTRRMTSIDHSGEHSIEKPLLPQARGGAFTANRMMTAGSTPRSCGRRGGAVACEGVMAMGDARLGHRGSGLVVGRDLGLQGRAAVELCAVRRRGCGDGLLRRRGSRRAGCRWARCAPCIDNRSGHALNAYGGFVC